MRRLLAAVSVLMVGAVAALSGAASAYAAPALPADLQVVASQVSGQIGGTAEVRLVVRNNGPNPVLPGTWELAITAPAGTQIAGGSALAGNCDNSDRGVRCRYGFGMRRGERHELKLGLRIDAQPSGCGRAAISYAMDPRDRNNAVNLRVAVDGVPRSCSDRAQASPPVKSPAATATPEAEITEAPPQDAPASAEALPAVPASDNGGGMSMAGILVIGGGLLLVALGGLLIWRLLRREPDDGEEEVAGPAATTAWNDRTAQWNAGPTQQWDAGPTQQWNAGPTQQRDAGPPTQQWDAGPPTQQWDAGLPTQQWDAGPSDRGGRHVPRPHEYPPGDDTGPIYGR